MTDPLRSTDVPDEGPGAGRPPPDLATCQAQLLELQREFEGFTYAVAHDLRAPLRAITGFLEALSDDHLQQLPPAGQAYLLRAVDCSCRAQRMVDTLLRLNRLARQPLERRPTPLADLVNNARREVGRDVAGRDLVWQIAELPVVVADRLMVQDALVQLLGNAIKFTRPQPRAVIEVFATRGGEETAFAVRDNGVGFNAARAEHLGQPFARFHGQQDFEGVGSGLAIAERIFRKHGGRLWAEAQEGRGATIYFTLGAEALPAGATG